MITRKKVIRLLAKNSDKVIILLSYLLLLLLIFGRNIPTEWQYIERGLWLETRTISNSNFTVTYSMNSGDNKPVIISSSGDELLTVDGWESVIYVDNVPRSLWDHVYRSVLAGNTLSYNMLWGSYQMMQYTMLLDNSVTMEYKIRTDENIDNLSLSLTHYYENFSMVKIGNTTINENLEDNQENMENLKYSIEVEVDLIVSIGENMPSWSLENAPYWFNLTFSLENLSAGYNWKKIAKITVSYSEIEALEAENSIF